MKTYYSNVIKTFISLLILLITTQSSFSQVTIGDYDFDTDLDGWFDGGFHAVRTTSTTYFCNNQGAIYLRYDFDFDNSSNFSSPVFNATAYSDLEFSLCLKTLSLEDNEGFDLQFFDGTNWNTVRQFRKGAANDFTGNGSGISTNLTHTINNATYTFPTDAQFRLVGQMSRTDEFTVFDDITIVGTLATPAPQINIQDAGGDDITDGGANSPSAANDTQFGSVFLSNSITETYTIENNGALDLVVSSLSSSSTDFVVTSLAPFTITSGGSTTFDVTFTPTTAGTINSIITVNSNNPTPNDVYTFDVQGIGIDPCPTLINAFPYNEGFETGLGNWIQDTTDDRDWTRDANGTPSNDTGPDNAHEGNFYMFTEGSDPNFNRVHNLISPCIDLTSETIAQLSFYYHMYGTNMGDLDVEVSLDNGVTWTGDLLAGALTGEDVDHTANNSPWKIATVDLSAYVGNIINIRFNGTTGFDFTSDMAIDDISIINSFSPTPEINITGNSINIPDGNTAIATGDNTDFGSTDNLTPVNNTFTIENLGSANLDLSSWTSSNGDFVISTAPATTIPSGGSTTFVVTFTPSGSGTISSVITINNNDNAPEDIYTFTVQGIGEVAPPQNTIYYETFDSSDGGWTNITSTNDSWTRTNSFTTTDEMGEGSFFRNTNYNSYISNTDIIIESPTYNLANINNLRLSLDIKYNCEDLNDGMRILYSVSGGAYAVLGSSAEGINWYTGNVSSLGGDGWYGDGHSQDPAFTPHSQFGRSTINLSNSIFSNQSNVRFRIQFTSDGSSNFEGVAFDNFMIEGDTMTSISNAATAPASLTNNLRLWLKANAGISNADNTPLTLWEDQAYGNASVDKEDALASTTLAPTFRDSGDRNINFNPIADFDNTVDNYMGGKGGLYSQDIFIVFRSDDTLENNTGSFSPGRQFAVGGRFSEEAYHEDATGIAAGSSTARYDDEVVAFNISSYPQATATSVGEPNDTSYGRAYVSTTDTFSNHPTIINLKTNAAGTASEIYKNGKRLDNMTGQSGNGADLNFNELENTPFLLGTGRSGINGRTSSKMNGMIAEVISYSSANSTVNQQKIQSYLAIKYGVTLQDDTSTLLDHRLNDADYIDSNGITIWDTSATDASSNVYNYDVAGIGRDDQSLLDQRQSRSQNDEADGTGPTSGFLTMGLTDIYDTNNLNIAGTSPLTDRNFLMWGNNNASLDAAPSTIDVNMSADISGLNTDVSFIGMQRIWRVVETGDVGRVKVSIPQSVVRNITPPGDYLMFISDTGIFTPTAQYRVMTADGSGNLSADYDFTGVKYVTFGYAPEIIVERSINFEPSAGNYIDVEDNLDLDTNFTLSTWILRETDSRDKSIISKRNVGYSEGYDLKILNNRRVEMSWINGGTRRIRSSVTIPENEWHHIAVTHDGTTARLYIDGVLDTTENLPLPLNTSRSFLIGAAGRDGASEDYFDGNIDEVRLWNAALNAAQIQFLMNQELEDNPGTIGKYFDNNSILPTKNDAVGLDFTNLRAYFPMSRYTYTNTNDDSGNDLVGYLRQLRTVDYQTAPLPYQSTQNGSWETNSTWTNGNVQTIPGARSIVDTDISVDWNIVETSHDITIDNSSLFDDDLVNIDDLDGNDNEGNRTVLAHILNAGTVTVNGDNDANTGFGYTVTHYLEMSGKLDLEGQSQLIQTIDSDLIVGPSGALEKDQQGTINTYRYNYWGSPVGDTSEDPSNLINENRYSYSVTDIFMDNGANVNFSSTGFDGDNTTSPIRIADYWIWKFANNTDGDYSEWEHMRRTGTMLAGEGFTMKGPGTTGSETEQNYTFLGKPNNADVNLTIGQYNDYLVGNPYASAIDARQFIIDNGPTLYYEDGITPEADATTSGTLYFWEHFGGNDHILANYQAGYGTYNLAGSLAAPFSLLATNDPDVDSGGTPTHVPGRYIPVGQGFFVVASNGGTINFNNGQRVFKKESAANGEFARTANTTASNSTTDEADPRPRIKFGFDSVGDEHRQLLLTIDENTTAGADWGYDAVTYEYLDDDMFWGIDNNFYVIQAADNMNVGTIYPLIIYTSTDGNNTIKIDELHNIDESQEIYLHDIELDFYHNLKEGDYEIFLDAGYYDARFEVVFENQNQSLSTDDDILDEQQLDVRYSNTIDKVVLINPHGLDVTDIQIFNILGQHVIDIKDIQTGNFTEYKVGNLSSGPYIIKLNTVSGSVSKKVLVD